MPILLHFFKKSVDKINSFDYYVFNDSGLTTPNRFTNINLGGAMKELTKVFSSQKKSKKGLSDPKFVEGCGVPVFTVIDDDRSPDYESAQFQDDWKDWEPNSWGY